MSVRWSSVRPWTCSGDMYGIVPITTPSRVRISVGSSELACDPSLDPPILARPKSRTFTRPSFVTMTLAGLRSR